MAYATRERKRDIEGEKANINIGHRAVTAILGKWQDMMFHEIYRDMYG